MLNVRGILSLAALIAWRHAHCVNRFPVLPNTLFPRYNHLEIKEST